jgi:hypothetical protein
MTFLSGQALAQESFVTDSKSTVSFGGAGGSDRDGYDPSTLYGIVQRIDRDWVTVSKPQIIDGLPSDIQIGADDDIDTKWAGGYTIGGNAITVHDDWDAGDGFDNEPQYDCDGDIPFPVPERVGPGVCTT